MKLAEFIKKELSGWGKYERIIFPSILLFIIILSFITGDNKVALGSAICGISYTILAGKGKISCYVFGLLGTFCYSYISYKNGFWGNLALYIFYCMPMQIVGIIKWSSHLKKDSNEIYKIQLRNRERIIYFAGAVLAIIILYFILKNFNGTNPLLDSVSTIMSILGILLTVKRCIEQWYIWFLVNGVSVLMWIGAYINGSNCLATILMWTTYFFLGIYFMNRWKKELSD